MSLSCHLSWFCRGYHRFLFESSSIWIAVIGRRFSPWFVLCIFWATWYWEVLRVRYVQSFLDLFSWTQLRHHNITPLLSQPILYTMSYCITHFKAYTLYNLCTFCLHTMSGAPKSWYSMTFIHCHHMQYEKVYCNWENLHTCYACKWHKRILFGGPQGRLAMLAKLPEMAMT